MAEVDARSAGEPGTTMLLDLDLNRATLFDPATGGALH